MLRITYLLKGATTALGVVAVFAVIVSTGLGVIGRYFHFNEMTWSFELTAMSFIWVTALGTIAAEVAGENVALDMIDQRVSDRGALVLAFFRALVLLVIAGFLLWSGLALLARTAFNPTAVMRAPMWLTHSSIIVVGAGLAIVALSRIAKLFRIS